MRLLGDIFIKKVIKKGFLHKVVCTAHEAEHPSLRHAHILQSARGTIFYLSRVENTGTLRMSC